MRKARTSVWVSFWEHGLHNVRRKRLSCSDLAADFFCELSTDSVVAANVSALFPFVARSEEVLVFNIDKVLGTSDVMYIRLHAIAAVDSLGTPEASRTRF
jgi:hypothetical protein